MIETLRRYYNCWVNSDREGAAGFLSEGFSYTGPVGTCSSAAEFLDRFWGFSEALTSVEVSPREDDGFTVEWTMTDGVKFSEQVSATVVEGKLTSLTVHQSG